MYCRYFRNFSGVSPRNQRVKYLEIPCATDLDGRIGFYHNKTHPRINTGHLGNPKLIWLEWNPQQRPRVCKLLFEFKYQCHKVPLCKYKHVVSVKFLLLYQPQPQREFQPIPPPEEPWYQGGMVLLRLYRTFQEFLHIVVILCCLTHSL